MLNRKVEIEFITEGTSPLVGNIWKGRKVTLNKATAQRFVDGGSAVFTDGKAAPEGGSEVVHLSLEDALKSLDHGDSAHWTKDGLPNLNVIKELTGKQYKRAEVEKAAPDLVRQDPAEESAETDAEGKTAEAPTQEG